MPTTTPYSIIYDMFMSKINDYKLVNLYNASLIDFETYLLSWLQSSIVEFDVCDQDLSLRDDETFEFDFEMTQKNIEMLAMFMVKFWLEKETQDVLQMNLHLQDKDFKHYAESQNLKSKQDYLINVKEGLSQKIIDYTYKNNSTWNNWLSGLFYVPS